MRLKYVFFFFLHFAGELNNPLGRFITAENLRIKKIFIKLLSNKIRLVRSPTFLQKFLVLNFLQNFQSVFAEYEI